MEDLEDARRMAKLVRELAELLGLDELKVLEMLTDRKDRWK